MRAGKVAVPLREHNTERACCGRTSPADVYTRLTGTTFPVIDLASPFFKADGPWRDRVHLVALHTAIALDLAHRFFHRTHSFSHQSM